MGCWGEEQGKKSKGRRASSFARRKSLLYGELLVRSTRDDADMGTVSQHCGVCVCVCVCAARWHSPWREGHPLHGENRGEAICRPRGRVRAQGMHFKTSAHRRRGAR